jgi:hypothetical protein
MMITVFDGIPDLFVELYDAQFQTWAREFRARGRKCAIVFNPPPGATPKFDGEGRMVAEGCWLEATVDLPAGKIEIRAASEHDAEMIARHCAAMRPHVLQYDHTQFDDTTQKRRVDAKRRCA